MKNLRKVLAVVLVVALAFSLMAIASANFSDNDKIKYSEAVGVMTGIGAINGMPDGSFDPQGLVTRAEAAKMITYAILGPTVAASLSKTTSTFSDVPTTYWASSFIQYCASKGIINGTGDGTFNPEGNVTGVELAKMMLCAAGYGVNKEFVGTDWAINVITFAMQNDVFKGNTSADFSVAATREEAALYIFNGIYNVNQVSYNDLFGYYGKGQTVASGNLGKTIAQDVYKMTNDKGVVTANTANGAIPSGTDISVATIDNGKVTKFDPATNYKFDSTIKDIGQLMSVYYATDTGKVFFTQTISSSVNVVAAITSSATQYYNAFGSLTMAPAANVWNFGSNYSTPVLDNSDPIAITGLTVGTTALAGTYATYGGQIVSFVPSTAITFEKVTAINTALGSESITLSSSGQVSNTAANDLVKEYSGIAVGDYVTVTRAGTVYNLAKCTTVDGTISNVGYFLGKPSTVTMNGTVYNASAATGAAGLTVAWPTGTDFANNTYTLYLDSNGNFITSVLKTGAAASSVVYVTGAAYQSTSDYGLVWKVQAVNTAGEQVIYNLGATKTYAGTNQFQKVTVDSSTGIAALSNPSNSDFVSQSDAITEVKTTDVSNTGDGNFSYFYDPNVTFIFVSGSGAGLTVTKLTGLSAVAGIGLDTGDELFFNNTASVNKTVSTVMCNNAFTGASTAATVFIPAYTAPVGTNANGTEYNVYIDGKLTKITSTDTNLADVNLDDDSVLGTFANYVVNDKGAYDFTGISAATNLGKTETVSKNGVFGNYITTDKAAVNASGATVIDLTQAPGDPAVYTSLAAMEAATTTHTFSVSYVKNTSGVATVVYVTAPVFTTAPVIADTSTNTVSGTVDVVLDFGTPAVANTGTLSYQWYSNTTNSTVGATAISGATSATYTLPVDIAADDYYFYCVVTSADTGATSVTSNILPITITAS